MKQIGILTGGGDAPGLNAVIRAVVKSVIQQFGLRILGIRDGFDGFLKPSGVVELTLADVRGILPRGGTILGTANRGNPFAYQEEVAGKSIIVDRSQDTIQAIRNLDMECLIVVGGDGTLHIAQELHKLGVPVLGVPKTIDNDIHGTDFTFGFDTAVTVATEAIDRLHTTAESHHRVMVLELMGRDAGFITLHAGLAGGADVILIPEIPFQFSAIEKKVRQRVERGSPFSIIAVAEGARPQGSQQVFAIPGDAVYTARLGGMGELVCKFINEQVNIEARAIVLGHLQRGGSPTPNDRLLATRLGAAAARLAVDGRFGEMVALQGDKITSIPLAQALEKPKRVDPYGDRVVTARQIGIAFGDEE